MLQLEKTSSRSMAAILIDYSLSGIHPAALYTSTSVLATAFALSAARFTALADSSVNAEASVHGVNGVNICS